MSTLASLPRPTQSTCTTIDTLLFKMEIVAAGIRRQEALIGDFRQRIADVLANEGNVNEEEYDNHCQSFKSEGISEVNLLNEQLQFAKQELAELRRIECTIEHRSEVVEFSSVVKTDRSTFFVSASLEEFQVAGRAVFGVSVNSPIYRGMKGRREGDIFSVKGVTYRILEIF